MTQSTTPNSPTNNLSNSTPCSTRPVLNRILLKAEKARRRLHEFVVQAWHVLERDVAFVDGVHVHAICEHLQAVTEGRIRNLLINVPPGHAKSLLALFRCPVELESEAITSSSTIRIRSTRRNQMQSAQALWSGGTDQ